LRYETVERRLRIANKKRKYIKMFSKSKLKKLGAQLKAYNVSMNEQMEATGVSRTTIWSIYAGKVYHGEVVKKLIALRDKKISEAKQLEKAI
jgi:hypothetical protein